MALKFQLAKEWFCAIASRREDRLLPGSKEKGGNKGNEREMHIDNPKADIDVWENDVLM